MSRQRDWALRAHNCVLQRKEANKSLSKYSTSCKKGPALIQRAGAAQALAFLRSRSEAEKNGEPKEMGRAYADDLATVLGVRDGAKLLSKAQTDRFASYLELSRNLLDASAWLQRFAQIELADVGEE